MTAPFTTTPFASAMQPLIPAWVFAPAVSGLDLSEDERQVMIWLNARLLNGSVQGDLLTSNLYYSGLNTVPSLGISVPPELESLRSVLGWCGAAIDARSERLSMQGFRMPGQTTIDEDLQTAWQWNNFDSESQQVHDDAMIYRSSFVTVGVNDNPDEPPLCTIESPVNMTASWDVRKRCVSGAYQTYFDVDPASETFNRALSTLYTRDATVHLVSGRQGWEVIERNDHNQGFVPVVMFANRPRTMNRYGISEITAAWRNTQDRACRSMVRTEIASEFFAAMKVWLLGTTEAAFQKGDGTIATAWETFTGRISTLEADKFGNLPQLVFQQGQSPDGMIKMMDHERQIMAGHTGLPPQFLGIFSDGNPASADAIRMSDFRLNKICDRLAQNFGNCWEDWARMVLRVWHGSVPDGAERLECEWDYTGIPTPNADAVTVTTQVAAGMIPPTSDDALARCDWSPVERARIAAERKRTEGLAVIQGALAGLKPPAQPGQPAQPMDGQQPAALAGLNGARSTDGASAG